MLVSTPKCILYHPTIHLESVHLRNDDWRSYVNLYDRRIRGLVCHRVENSATFR